MHIYFQLLFADKLILRLCVVLLDFDEKTSAFDELFVALLLKDFADTCTELVADGVGLGVGIGFKVVSEVVVGLALVGLLAVMGLSVVGFDVVVHIRLDRPKTQPH